MYAGKTDLGQTTIEFILIMLLLLVIGGVLTTKLLRGSNAAVPMAQDITAQKIAQD